jgi:RHS repeat-associated protein
VLEEYAPGGVLAATYMRGMDLLFQDRSGVRSYYAKDGLGSTRALTNSAGAVTDTYTYDVFGNLVGHSGITVNGYLFAGAQFDAALGEYDLRARYESTATGRFLSADTKPGQSDLPLTFNRFAYAGDDPANNTDPSGLDFSLTETLSVQGISNTLQTGLGYFDTAVRAYNTARNLVDLLTYADLVVQLLGAFAQPTPQAVAGALVAAVQKRLGASDVSSILGGFTSALAAAGPHWNDISKAIMDKSPQIAAEVALRVESRIPKYIGLQAQGRLKPVFFATTGPGARSMEHYINVGSKLQIGLAASGGRLFGFGLRTSSNNVDQIFRIDYWDVRKPPLRPTPTPLHVHYHILGDGHMPDRTIWP